jgi:hypothetical protein
VRLPKSDTISQAGLPQRWSDLFKRRSSADWYDARYRHYELVEGLLAVLDVDSSDVTLKSQIMLADDWRKIPEVQVRLPAVLSCCAALGLAPPRGKDSTPRAMQQLEDLLRSDGRGERAVDLAYAYFFGSPTERERRVEDKRALALKAVTAATREKTRLLTLTLASLTAAVLVENAPSVKNRWRECPPDGVELIEFEDGAGSDRVLMASQAVPTEPFFDGTPVAFECPDCKSTVFSDLRLSVFDPEPWTDRRRPTRKSEYWVTCRHCDCSLQVLPRADPPVLPSWPLARTIRGVR